MGHNDFDQDIQQSDGSPWPDCPEGEAATTAMVRLGPGCSPAGWTATSTPGPSRCPAVPWPPTSRG